MKIFLRKTADFAKSHVSLTAQSSCLERHISYRFVAKVKNNELSHKRSQATFLSDFVAGEGKKEFFGNIPRRKRSTRGKPPLQN